jgi:hypothetical protein
LTEEPPNERGTHEMGATPKSHPSISNIGMYQTFFRIFLIFQSLILILITKQEVVWV